jgi:hypothetical protein
LRAPPAKLHQDPPFRAPPPICPLRPISPSFPALTPMPATRVVRRNGTSAWKCSATGWSLRKLSMHCFAPLSSAPQAPCLAKTVHYLPAALGRTCWAAFTTSRSLSLPAPCLASTSYLGILPRNLTSMTGAGLGQSGYVGGQGSWGYDSHPRYTSTL